MKADVITARGRKQLARLFEQVIEDAASGNAWQASVYVDATEAIVSQHLRKAVVNAGSAPRHTPATTAAAPRG